MIAANAITVTAKAAGGAVRQRYIDLLRGFFIFVIIIDHVGMWPNGYELLTGKGALWVSAAEGFFIISGMMVGVIRGREWVKKGWQAATKKLWLRAAQLYVLAVGLTLFFTAAARWLGNVAPVKDGALANDSWSSIILQSLTGQYVYGWSDFLIYYAVFLLIAPVVLWALARGWWLGVVAVSLVVYAFGQGHFGMLWQPLFFGGLLLGYYFSALQAVWQKLGQGKRRLVLRGMFGLTLITLTMSTLFVHFQLFQEWYQGNAQYLFERFYGFGFGRILLAPLWFGTLIYLFKRYQDHIIKFAGWLFFPLGRNALMAYTLQGIFVFFVHLFVAQKGMHFILNFAVTSLIIVAIWYIVKVLQPHLSTLHRKLQI